jgi:hypothetical protein
MSQHQQGARLPADDPPEDDDVDWTIFRTMLAANIETSRAMESHFLRVHYGERGDSGAERTEEHIERAIARHERIIEDLRLAKATIDRRE